MTAISEKVIWITGASSGIGKALAQTAAQQNTKLILSGRRVDALESLARELPVDCLVLPFEVTDYDVLASKVDEAWAEMAAMAERERELQAKAGASALEVNELVEKIREAGAASREVKKIAQRGIPPAVQVEHSGDIKPGFWDTLKDTQN